MGWIGDCVKVNKQGCCEIEQLEGDQSEKEGIALQQLASKEQDQRKHEDQVRRNVEKDLYEPHRLLNPASASHQR
jgi:hypothetical protein